MASPNAALSITDMEKGLVACKERKSLGHLYAVSWVRDVSVAHQLQRMVSESGKIMNAG